LQKLVQTELLRSAASCGALLRGELALALGSAAGLSGSALPSPGPFVVREADT
jgi:hypothetical protein